MTHYSTREQVLLALAGPRCAREVAEGIGIPSSSAQTTIRRLAEDHLIECITPDMTQARIYALTSLGKTKRYDLTRERLEAEPAIDWDTYAYVQSGSYRRRVLLSLHEQATVRQIRKILVESGCGMQQSHIHSTLSDLEDFGLATNENRQGWKTTPAGSTMRAYMLDEFTNQTASDPGHRGVADRDAGRIGPAA